MKKNFLTLLFASLLVFSGFAFTSCSNDDNNEFETSVLLKDLPAAAQSFLSQYYPNVAFKSAEKQQIKDIYIYEVELQDGTEITFNSAGEWQEVDAPEGKTVPSGFYPSGIDEYLSQNYSGYGINEINKYDSGYNVELVNNGPELEFNLMGEFVRVISEF